MTAINSKQHSPHVWSQDAITAFLHQMRIPLRLAAVTRTGWPLVVSLWYLYENGRLHCATQNTAKIVTHLGREPRCAFEVAADQPPYRGVRGQGKAHISPRRGTEILTRLLERYLGGTSSSLAKRLLARSVDEVVIEVEPIAFTTWDFTVRMRNSVPDEQNNT
jgi:nitroimidazol reductase NimA-like FMN-containing flavoprotein (pyridoxamine 5'-phosphate oxidase superfamily)